MNKTDRLLAIVLELQGKGRQRAEDLAHTFETSKRTIYRDIQALCEAGVPLVAVPGQGYTLMEGYFLPPLSFTPEEAHMLLLGSNYMARNFDSHYRKAALAAARKITGILPEPIRQETQSLQESMMFVGPTVNAAEQALLQRLRSAILEHRVIRFRYRTRYHKVGQPAENTREANPYGLTYMSKNWYLAAYCHLRQGIRNFRLDRMQNVELLAQTFQRPPGFRMQEHQPDEEPRNLTIQALFDNEVIQWVRETRPYHTVSEEEHAHGLLMTFKVRREDEMLQWLLSWGRHVRVLEPASLRQRLREEATALLQQYSEA